MPSLRMMKRKNPLLAIAGGGIAGLASALFLARSGFEVMVFEKEQQIQTKGAGIQLSPNAFKILDSIGLTHHLKADGYFPDHINIRSGLNMQLLTRFPLGEQIRHRYGAPYLLIHRADLLHRLLDACKSEHAVHLFFDHKVYNAFPHAHGIKILVRNGEIYDEYLVTALVGADGVWSTIRKQLEGAIEPEFSHTVAWRTLLPHNEVDEKILTSSIELWLGPNAHIVTYPVRDAFNIVAITPFLSDKNPDSGRIKDRNRKNRLSFFIHWHDSARHLVNLTSDWEGWPIYSLIKPHKPFKEKNGLPICLVGDAAHTMLPFAAQGSASALEDAAILAKWCHQTPEDLETSFKNYAKERHGRIKYMIKLSAQNRLIYHASGLVSCARDWILQLIGNKIINHRTARLYSWTADSSSPP